MPLDRRELLKSLAALSLGIATGGMPAPRKKLKILILGGTGFLGPHVVEYARSRGHTLTLFNRGKTQPHLFPDIEKLVGDRDGKLDALKGRTWDAVIDNSGYVPREVKLSAEMLKDSGFYLFVSTISVYPDLEKENKDESSPVGKIADETVEDVTNDSYGPLKALCEQAAERAMPGRTVTVRPGLIVGPGDFTHRFSYWPVRVRDGGEVLAPGKPEWGIQYVDVRDLAEWMVHLVENKTTGTYNALGPEKPTPMKELLETSKAVSKSDATFTWVDLDFLTEQKVRPWVELPSWSPPAEGASAPPVTSNARAIAKGLKFRPLEATVRDLLAWYAVWTTESSPTSTRPRPKAARGSLTREREREVLAAWHARKK